MAFVRLMCKAAQFDKRKLELDQEKKYAVQKSRGEPEPKRSLKQKYRHGWLDCVKKLRKAFRKRFTFPKNSCIFRCCYKIRHDGSCENYTLKSVVGFIGGFLITYVFFMFSVFQLNFKFSTATIMCSIFGSILTIGLAFSYKVRCIVFLTLPQLFSKRGRQALLAYAFILAITGPAKNTLNNMGILSESLACGQEQLKAAVKQILEVVKKPFYAIRDAIRTVVKVVKVIVRKIKEILLTIKRIIMAIVKVIKSVFEFLAKIINICNKELGTPFQRCTRVFENAITDCYAKLGPAFSWLCSLTYLVQSVCYTVKMFDFVCEIVDFISNSIVGVVVRKIRTFVRHIKTMFYVRIKFSHSFHFETNASKSLEDVATGIVTEIKARTQGLVKVFDFMSCATSLFFMFIIFRVLYYRYKFLTDERFDNRFITKDFRTIDMRRAQLGKETVLPLNHRERNKYIAVGSCRLVKKEKLKLSQSAVVLGMASLKLATHMTADYVLFWVLLQIRAHGSFQSTFEGSSIPTLHVKGEGLLADLLRSIVKAFQPVGLRLEIDTIPCLPDPIPPDYDRYVQIASLLVICWLLMIFEPFGLRWRHSVMCFYHPQRAKERSIWLYNHILRTRSSFLKFARRQLRRKFKGDPNITKITCKEYLRANLRCRVFRLCLGKDLQMYCLLCGEVFRENEPIKPIRCQTPNCPGIYCEKCFQDLQNICTVCLDPIQYGDLSDISEEKDSSEVESKDRKWAVADDIGEEETDSEEKKRKRKKKRKHIRKKSTTEDDSDTDSDDEERSLLASDSLDLSTTISSTKSTPDSDYYSSEPSTDLSYSYQYRKDITEKAEEPPRRTFVDVEKQRIPDYALMDTFRDLPSNTKSDTSSETGATYGSRAKKLKPVKIAHFTTPESSEIEFVDASDTEKARGLSFTPSETDTCYKIKRNVGAEDLTASESAKTIDSERTTDLSRTPSETDSCYELKRNVGTEDVTDSESLETNRRKKTTYTRTASHTDSCYEVKRNLGIEEFALLGLHPREDYFEENYKEESISTAPSTSISKSSDISLRDTGKTSYIPKRKTQAIEGALYKDHKNQINPSTKIARTKKEQEEAGSSITETTFIETPTQSSSYITEPSSKPQRQHSSIDTVSKVLSGKITDRDVNRPRKREHTVTRDSVKNVKDPSTANKILFGRRTTQRKPKTRSIHTDTECVNQRLSVKARKSGAAADVPKINLDFTKCECYKKECTKRPCNCRRYDIVHYSLSNAPSKGFKESKHRPKKIRSQDSSTETTFIETPNTSDSEAMSSSSQSRSRSKFLSEPESKFKSKDNVKAKRQKSYSQTQKYRYNVESRRGYDVPKEVPRLNLDFATCECGKKSCPCKKFDVHYHTESETSRSHKGSIRSLMFSPLSDKMMAAEHMKSSPETNISSKTRTTSSSTLASNSTNTTSTYNDSTPLVRSSPQDTINYLYDGSTYDDFLRYNKATAVEEDEEGNDANKKRLSFRSFSNTTESDGNSRSYKNKVRSYYSKLKTESFDNPGIKRDRQSKFTRFINRLLRKENFESPASRQRPTKSYVSASESAPSSPSRRNRKKLPHAQISINSKSQYRSSVPKTSTNIFYSILMGAGLATRKETTSPSGDDANDEAFVFLSTPDKIGLYDSTDSEITELQYPSRGGSNSLVRKYPSSNTGSFSKQPSRQYSDQLNEEQYSDQLNEEQLNREPSENLLTTVSGDDLSGDLKRVTIIDTSSGKLRDQLNEEQLSREPSENLLTTVSGDDLSGDLKGVTIIDTSNGKLRESEKVELQWEESEAVITRNTGRYDFHRRIVFQEEEEEEEVEEEEAQDEVSEEQPTQDASLDDLGNKSESQDLTPQMSNDKRRGSLDRQNSSRYSREPPERDQNYDDSLMKKNYSPTFEIREYFESQGGKSWCQCKNSGDCKRRQHQDRGYEHGRNHQRSRRAPPNYPDNRKRTTYDLAKSAENLRQEQNKNPCPCKPKQGNCSHSTPEVGKNKQNMKSEDICTPETCEYMYNDYMPKNEYYNSNQMDQMKPRSSTKYPYEEPLQDNNYDNENHERNCACDHCNRRNEYRNCKCCHCARNVNSVMDDQLSNYSDDSQGGINLAYQKREEYPELVDEIENTISQRNKERVRRTMRQFEILSRQNKGLDKPIYDDEEEEVENMNRYSCNKRNCPANRPRSREAPCYSNARPRPCYYDRCSNYQTRSECLSERPAFSATPFPRNRGYVEKVAKYMDPALSDNVQKYPKFQSDYSNSRWHMDRRTGEWTKVCDDNYDFENSYPPLPAPPQPIYRDYDNYAKNQNNPSYYNTAPPRAYSPMKRSMTPTKSCNCRNCMQQSSSNRYPIIKPSKIKSKRRKTKHKVNSPKPYPDVCENFERRGSFENNRDLLLPPFPADYQCWSDSIKHCRPQASHDRLYKNLYFGEQLRLLPSLNPIYLELQEEYSTLDDRILPTPSSSGRYTNCTARHQESEKSIPNQRNRDYWKTVNKYVNRIPSGEEIKMLPPPFPRDSEYWHKVNRYMNKSADMHDKPNSSHYTRRFRKTEPKHYNYSCPRYGATVKYMEYLNGATENTQNYYEDESGYSNERRVPRFTRKQNWRTADKYRTACQKARRNVDCVCTERQKIKMHGANFSFVNSYPSMIYVNK